MRTQHILAILLCCIIWGANVPITKWALGEVPPLFLGFMRFVAVSICLSPFLFPIPKQIGKLILLSFCIGSGNFIFLFSGLVSIEAGTAAIIGQLGLPITILLSIILLGEKISGQQIFALLLAFIGVIIIIYNPQEITIKTGVWFVLISTIIYAFGSIIMKNMQPIGSLQLQAWVALLSILPMLVASLMTEEVNLRAIMHESAAFWAAIGFAVFAVSIIGHATYYSLVKEYDVSKVIGYTITVPIWAILIGHFALGEAITSKFVIGASISLLGILLLAIPNLFFNISAKGNISR